MGDAGALVTDDADLPENMRALREHGQTAKYKHELEGWTARLDTIQAIVLLRKLPMLDGGTKSAVGSRVVRRSLAGVGDIRMPPIAEGSEPVWHLFVVRTARPRRAGAPSRAAGSAPACITRSPRI